MNRVFCSVLVMLGSAVVLPQTAADAPEQKAETIVLGGLRDAEITIRLLKGQVVVVIEMRPVSCFDDTTNAAVNQRMAEGYGLSAFCRSSFGKARLLAHDSVPHGWNDVVINGVLVDAAGPEGGKYRLRLVFPEDDIQPPPNKPIAAKPLDRSSSLFTRYSDHEATIRALAQTLAEELVSIVKDLAGAEGSSSAGRATLAALRTAGTKRFAAMRGVIQGDNLLLDTTERPQLLEKVAAAEQEWNREVDASVESLSVDR